MRRRELLAAWAWDQIPTHWQLAVWRRFTWTAIYCEHWANERDFRRRYYGHTNRP